MCGIVGYISSENNIKNVILEALSEMEYRGYDSAGLAFLNKDQSLMFKEVGKLNNLVLSTKNVSSETYHLGVGHTRWATHGAVTKENAHPHKGEHSLVVHNGIIENFSAIKTKLLNNNVKFVSETDTEVIVHLFEFLLTKNNSNPLKAFEDTIQQLDGSYAILLVSSLFPEQIFFAKQNVPLIIGYSNNEVQIVSSNTAFHKNIKRVHYLNDGDYGYVNKNSCRIFNSKKEIIDPSFVEFSAKLLNNSKENYRYYMEKEILEQNKTLKSTIENRIIDNTINFEELPKDFFKNINRIILCACGTSYHAGLVASYILERHTNISTLVQIASEFRYRLPVLKKDDLVIFISQSGETADTLSSLKYCKSKNIRTLVISNVENSSLVRSSTSILTHVGVEKSVASTKAFSSQVLVLWMLALFIAKNNKNLSQEEISTEINNIKSAIQACEVTNSLNDNIVELINSLDNNYRYIFLGRDIFYPLALEGALKLKEITYISAEGYPSGEMKHGPIAIADSNLCTIALNPVNLLYEKTKSNILEIASRDSRIINISSVNFNNNYSFIKTIETNSYMVEFFRSMVILQLFAMHTAIKFNKDVDMPRNLAKSVTVE